MPRSANDWKAVERGASAIKSSSNALTDNQVDANVLAARKRIESGEYAQAKVLFERAAKEQPANAQAWWGLGHALLRMDRPVEAKRALFNALRLKPDDPNAWLRLAEVVADADARAVDSDGVLRLAVYFSTNRPALRRYVSDLTPEIARPEFVAVIKADAGQLESIPERKP